MANRPRDTDHILACVNGSPHYLGTITAAGATINNNTTAVPFNNTGTGLGGKLLLLQPDAVCSVIQGTSNTVTATATSAITLAVNQLYTLWCGDGEGWVAVVGTANVKVFELI